MLYVTGKIIKYDGRFLLVEPTEDIGRLLNRQKPTTVEIRIDDGRTITTDQRKKIFAIIRDIANWSGHIPQELRSYLTWNYCAEYGIEPFSLSDTTVSIARDFTSYLIDFCFYHDIPSKDTRLNQTDDIGKYLYLCLEHRKCAICNKPAEVHHVDRVGMGRDREHIVHEGMKAIALCREHHNLAHVKEKQLFEKYHIYGIRLDKYLCDVLYLHRNNDRGAKDGKTSEDRT